MRLANRLGDENLEMTLAQELPNSCQQNCRPVGLRSKQTRPSQAASFAILEANRRALYQRVVLEN